jgi:hypothetical protein
MALGQSAEVYFGDALTRGDGWDVATDQAIADSLWEGRPESVHVTTYHDVSGTATDAGVWGTVQAGAQAAVQAVGSALQQPLNAVSGLLSGIATTGQYLPLILTGLGALALYIMLPKGNR